MRSGRNSPRRNGIRDQELVASARVDVREPQGRESRHVLAAYHHVFPLERRERGVDVAGRPEHHHVQDKAERAELILRPLPVALAQLVALAVEHRASQAVAALGAVELGEHPPTSRTLPWPLPPLALPPEHEVDPVRLGGYEAVALFVDRAAARVPGFALDAHAAPLVARICTQLDGLPLALELAAARLPALSLSDLAARLDDRFAVLSRGNGAAPPRQQTLRATMD